MSRRFLLILAAFSSLAGYDLAYGQDAQPVAAPAASAVEAAAPAGEDVAALKVENAALKKEVADAKNTITQLQSKLVQADALLESANVPKSSIPSATDTPAPGPQKALPLDATNLVASPAAPGTPADAGSSRTYTVVKGDSLWKIAHKMYPHDTKNGVDKIAEANKDAIGGKPLKIGQVLVIPQ